MYLSAKNLHIILTNMFYDFNIYLFNISITHIHIHTRTREAPINLYKSMIKIQKYYKNTI